MRLGPERETSRCMFAILLLLSAVLIGCAPPPNEGFAIYLPAQEMPASGMAEADLASVPLQDAPIISTDDIVSYTWATHEIELTTAAFQRIQQLQVPVSGRVFIACVGSKPVYWGAFWTPLSSLSFDGVVIMEPFASASRLLRVELGYPSGDFFAGDDPRADPEIQRSLEQAGKLR